MPVRAGQNCLDRLNPFCGRSGSAASGAGRAQAVALTSADAGARLAPGPLRYSRGGAGRAQAVALTSADAGARLSPGPLRYSRAGRDARRR